MNQTDFDQEIANQTGDSVYIIRSMGFSLLRTNIPIEERQEPLMIDWDEHDKMRMLRVARRI